MRAYEESRGGVSQHPVDCIYEDVDWFAKMWISALDFGIEQTYYRSP
jgi:hypothetical protein